MIYSVQVCLQCVVIFEQSSHSENILQHGIVGTKTHKTGGSWGQDRASSSLDPGSSYVAAPSSTTSPATPQQRGFCWVKISVVSQFHAKFRYGIFCMNRSYQQFLLEQMWFLHTRNKLAMKISVLSQCHAKFSIMEDCI